MKTKLRCNFVCLLLTALVCSNALADGKWYKSYADAKLAMERGDWSGAVQLLTDALSQKNSDTQKTRAYGAVFMEYFPNREIGICYFHLGDLSKARTHLELSLQQSPSDRARQYYGRLTSGQGPAPQPTMASPTTRTTPPPSVPKPSTPSPEPSPGVIIGERLTLAILPFATKGIGGELGDIDLLDKLTTVFVNLNRFKIIERAQLEKILEEQKQGMAGIVDVSTAAEIGKGIGVDAVVCGSIARAGNVASIDARLVDTETAAIITARDAFSNGINLPSLSQMLVDVSNKIKADVPLVNGYVINVTGERLTLDLGRASGMRKGMKCHVYREGEPIVHPVTKEVIGRSIEELCEVQVSEVFDNYSVGQITRSKSGLPQLSDRVVTK